MDKKVIRILVPVAAVVLAGSISVAAYMGSRNTYKNTGTKQNTTLTIKANGKDDVSKAATTSAATTSAGIKENPGQANTTTPQAASTTQSGIKVKALYLTGWTVGSMEKVKHYADLANSTEINSYVVDIKDDDGYVGYQSSVPAVKEIGAWKKKYDVDKVIKEFHDNNIYVIGRVVCFKDPVFSSKRPELAVKRSNGNTWRDNHGLTWLSPFNKDSWAYIVDIAREGSKKGFDEIQFDYVRFPNDGDKKAMYFGDMTQKKYEVIDEFLAYVKKELPGVRISADVFGIICESPGDTEGIGQNIEYVGRDIDAISPMAYPSHYAAGQIINKIKYPKPDLDPYGVVYNSLVKAKSRISKVSGYKADVRPYLQDFTATWLGKGYYHSYGEEQVKQQIKAVYDAGYEQWILWDAGNSYSESALVKDP